MNIFRYHFIFSSFLFFLVFYIGVVVCSYAQIECTSDRDLLIERESKNAEDLPDVFIVVIDSLRADHVSAYGYYRNTTPFIDSIAEKSLVFERAYSPSSFTRESVSALFMGKYPSSTPWSIGWMAQIDPSSIPISECFASNGYQTFLYTDNPVLVPEIFGRGFQFIEYYTSDYDKSGNGDTIVEKFISEVSKVDLNQPVFVYFHFYDPHHPYEPTPSYYLRFANKIYQKPLSLYGDVRPNVPELVKQGFGPGEERFEDLVLRYDAEISMVDDSIRKLYRSISKIRAQRKSIWIITADHGEEFLDHGFVEHAWRLYVESIHVPLIIHITSEQLKGKRIRDEVTLVDIYPTLVSILKLPCKENWDGLALPLSDWIKGGEKSLGADRIIVSELAIPTRTIGMSLIKNGWQYLCWYKWFTVEQCSEYAKIQKDLRESYEKGEFSYPKYCSAPIVYEEFISPDEKGIPRSIGTLDTNNLLFSELIRFREKWCATRPEEKSVEEKKRLLQNIRSKDGFEEDTKDKEQGSKENEGNDFDPLKHAGYF